jgi:prepilin peptidase CpaA
MPDTTSIAFAAALIVLLAVSAACDLRAFRIPNRVSAAVLALLPVAWLLGAAIAPPVLDAAVACALVFAPTYALWRMGMFGGGDVKLLSTTAAWAGCHGLGVLLLWTALSGGMLSVVALLIRRLPAASPIRAVPGMAALGAGGGQVPYGAAIFVGGVAMVLSALGGLG